MDKVHPYILSSSSSCSFPSERETFTIWMKSLLINGNGYTVYDSNGEIVYRIDNYDTKSRNEVFLMDLRGDVIFTILGKKFLTSGLWDGYNSYDPKKNEKPWFKVTKGSNYLKRDSSSSYIVTMGCDEHNQQSSFYKIEGIFGRKMDFDIRDCEGRIVAEVKQKESSCGVILKDVLSLKVEPLVDHSFIMALVAVYELINCKM